MVVQVVVGNWKLVQMQVSVILAIFIVCEPAVADIRVDRVIKGSIIVPVRKDLTRE